jgi:hypothetical protein
VLVKQATQHANERGIQNGGQTASMDYIRSMTYPFHTSVKGRYISARPTGTPKFTQTIILCPNLLPIHVDKSRNSSSSASDIKKRISNITIREC